MREKPLLMNRSKVSVGMLALIVILAGGFWLPWGDLVLKVNKQKQLRQTKLVEKAINIDGLTTRYLLSSSDQLEEIPLVVFFSGFGDDRFSFIKVAELLEGQVNLLLPDIPGFTRESYKDDIKYSQSFYRDYFMRLLGAWPKRKLILVGKSIGGQIAVNLAAELSDRVVGLILIAPTGLNEKNSLPFSLALSKTATTDEYMAYLKSIFYKAPSVPEFVIKSLIKERQAKQAFLPEVLGKIMSDKNLYNENIFSLVKAPAWLYWGKNDQIVAPSMAKKWSEHWPGLNIVELEECGHVPHYEKPEIIAQKIKDLMNY